MMKRIAALLLTMAVALCAALPVFAAGTIEVTEDVSVSDDYDWTRFKGQNVTLNVYNWGEYISNGSDDSVDVVAAFEKAGAIAVVIEAIPSEVAKIIYERSNIPILGTGCGPYSDSPMINFYDMLGYYDRNPKFVKKYADVHKVAVDAVSQFVQECHDGTYPGPEHCYKMKAGEEEKLKELLKEQGL